MKLSKSVLDKLNAITDKRPSIVGRDVFKNDKYEPSE